MALTGRIVSIKLEHIVGNSDIKTMAQSLAAKGKGRVPGTGTMLLPKKENNNTYRTGINENAPNILRIEDIDGRKAEIARIKEMRERLQRDCNIDDLTPTSKYWNYALWTALDTNHVVPEKLLDGNNIFNFDNPYRELTFRWLSVHPNVAPSYEAWQRGDAGPHVMFYVYDEQIENDIAYKRKQEVNGAIVKLNSSSPEKRKKVAKLLGLPISDASTESLVYNLIDNKLKETEFRDGKYKGLSVVRMFNKFMDMQGKIFDAKVLVNEAISYNVYREKSDGIFEGETKLADTEDSLVNVLTDNLKQDVLIALEEKVKTKKLSVL